MKQAVKQALVSSKSDYEKMKAIARAYTTKRKCSVQEIVYLVMPQLLVEKNSNLPEKCYKIFKKKFDIEELFVSITDLFQQNMLDRYFNCPNESFKNGECKVIDKLCCAEFLLCTMLSQS